ncbi:DUF1353 domain-containing protein [Nocardia sp. NPDC050406]|uniref:DUF1353 domain-containing protein n=1 Tax=Nocardia sp. NPDC050406 TaxID=3364318 RepID=UPI00378C22E6
MMRLDGEQTSGAFYDGGRAPAKEAADAVAPEAVVVNVAPEPKQRPAPEPRAVEPQPDLTIALDRHFDTRTGREEFRLLRRIGYLDDAPNGVGQILVPGNLESWTTDLTSVPWFLTWLVPKTGAHLPAAILHDGLVLNRDEPASYIAERVIHRDEADRIFRDAMAATGTGLIRRWMVWAAVTAATMHHARQVDWTPLRKWHYRTALWGTLGVIVLLGLWSTLDILDAPAIPGVPWIAERPIQALIGGAAGAIAIPLLLGTAWGKFRIAGWIIGPLVALVIPAILPIVLIGGLAVAVDRLQRRSPWLARIVGIVFVVATFVVFAVSWWTA